MAGTINDFRKQLAAMTQRVDNVNTVMAPVAVGMVQANMTNGPWTPNAPMTTALKNGGSRPLIETGETRASITFRLMGNSFVVGTNKKHAPLINFGGTVTAKKARMLILPASKEVKKRMDSWGVKQTLSWLESSGWQLIWRPGALIGKCPEGRKGFGVQIASTKGKARRRSKKISKRFRYYLICYRRKNITVPKREFMVLRPEQIKALRDIGQQYLFGGKK